ncbi:MAG: cytochrome b/b6 domain-containing protein [Magnetococcus sp. YQC-9]
MYYDRFTRLLHALIAVGIVGQLAVSLVMIHPKPGRPGDAFYAVHESWGVILLGLLVIHWIWRLIQTSPVPFKRFFPWFSLEGWRAVWADGQHHLAHIQQLRLPNETTPGALVCAVQGLGVLVATLLGITGTIFLIYVEPNVRPAGWLHAIKELHEGLGVAMWGYLGLHAGMGILHQLAGHGSLTAMFRFWVKKSQTDSSLQHGS